MSEPWQRCLLMVSIDAEKGMTYSASSVVSKTIRDALAKELSKKKHKLGEVRVNVHQQDNLEARCWDFARAIRQAAGEAVSERIR